MPAILATALSTLAAVAAERLFVAERSDAYDAFREQFGSNWPSADELDNMMRIDFFERRSEEVQRHNAQPGRLWTAAVNEFADYSDAEFRELLGHRPSAAGPSSPQSGSFLQLGGSSLAASIDWGERLNATTRQAKVQGNCGSCWAVSVVGALETHAGLAGLVHPVSYEQLVDCVANPSECGGQGGCTGATAELALDYVQKHGLVAKNEYSGYQSGGDGKCRVPARPPVLTVQSFIRLPSNEYWSLLEAVATQGPVVVAVDAAKWSMYHKGVFNGCERDATINHAVLMMGYGTDESVGKDYFLIRNSWGHRWGIGGFIHLLRDSSDDYCGIDRQPLEGTGCKGGPSEMQVCGMCGVLMDSSYPTGVRYSPRESVSV